MRPAIQPLSPGSGLQQGGSLAKADKRPPGLCSEIILFVLGRALYLQEGNSHRYQGKGRSRARLLPRFLTWGSRGRVQRETAANVPFSCRETTVV